MLSLFFDHHSFDARLLFRDIPYTTEAFIYPLGSHSAHIVIFLSLKHHRHLSKLIYPPPLNMQVNNAGLSTILWSLMEM